MCGATMAHGEYKEPRGRNFAWVQKLENLPDNWEEKLKDMLLPVAWIVHRYDVHEDGTPVEPHVHVFVYFNGKRTASGVVQMFSWANIGYCEKIECKNAYLAYMLHIGKEDKYRYEYEELKIANGLKVNYADLADVDFGDVLDFANEYGIVRFSELVRATKAKEPPLFRYVCSHYALVCAYFGDVRDAD